MGNDFWVEFLLPVLICVLLPVLIIFIVGRVRKNETDRKAEVMLKAIENGTPIDPDLFKSQRKARKARTTKEKLLDNLTGGCVTGLLGLALFLIGFFAEGNGSFMAIAGAVLLAIGIANLIVFIIGRKMMSKEIEAEEKQISQGE